MDNKIPLSVFLKRLKKLKKMSKAGYHKKPHVLTTQQKIALALEYFTIGLMITVIVVLTIYQIIQHPDEIFQIGERLWCSLTQEINPILRCTIPLPFDIFCSYRWIVPVVIFVICMESSEYCKTIFYWIRCVSHFILSIFYFFIVVLPSQPGY